MSTRDGGSVSKDDTRGKISIATCLGWVSFFNDCSNEVITRAMPLLLTAGLGMTPAYVGVIEGIAECLNILIRGAAGWISDHMSSRKPLVVFGYSLSVLSRVLMLAINIPFLFGMARIVDRAGKGIRTAPRDAMVADSVATGMSGRAFGITRFLDTLGAVTGIVVVLLLGIGREALTPDSFRQIVWVSLPFALSALLTLVLGVPRVMRQTPGKKLLSFHVPQEIRGYLVAVGIFSLGNSSDAFLVLRAHELGFSFTEILFVLIAFNGLASLLAIPVGRLSDKIGRVSMLLTGWLVYAACYGCFAAASSQSIFVLALSVYGVFYGFTEGTEKALLADLLPLGKRGVGYGALQMVIGLSALPASMLTGWLMAEYGSAAAFGVAACLAGCGAVSLFFVLKKP